MYSSFFNGLSKEGKELVVFATSRLSGHYDEQSGMVCYNSSGKKYRVARPSLYYALGLMLINEEGCEKKVERLCEGVISTQIDEPNEIFHGSYHHDGTPECKSGVMDYKRLGVYGRYFTDLFFERNMDAFRLSLKADERFAPYALEIEELLGQAVLSQYPVVWKCYEPNSREFILMCFAMLLEHFSDKLSEKCVQSIEKSCKIALEGAVMRSKSDFSPLNTNIQCMHVFALDYFGARLNMPEYCEYALSYAEEMVQKYLVYHAVAEFNSPTYCGVDLATLGFWRRYGSNERLRGLGKVLEEGIWRDMAEFFNPAMMNFCGPYSRAYELNIVTHTSFCAMLYWALGEEKFPMHPLSAESSGDPLMVFGGINLPDDVRESLFKPKNDVVLRHKFRELSERGEPGKNDALCEATGWITPDLMTGALAGSENPSYQLHPVVVFWRGEKGIGTIKLLRSTPEGKMNHMHTVYFNAVADKNRITVDVDFSVNRDVLLFFEIEYPGISKSADISDTEWRLPGMSVSVNALAPACVVERNVVLNSFLGDSPKDNILRVCYLSEALIPETKKMHFDMLFSLDAPQ